MHILAIDTTTETLSLALRTPQGDTCQERPGGAQASHILLPTLLQLLQEAEIDLAQLDAIAFGQGPGAFTGLRTACAVAQGLGYAQNIPLLPVSSLLTLAQGCRHAMGAQKIYAVLDARMGEAYAACVDFSRPTQAWMESVNLLSAPSLCCPSGYVQAGNLGGILQVPRAQDMLALAPALLQAGGAIPAEQAQPYYRRDQVALTIQERLTKVST